MGNALWSIKKPFKAILQWLKENVQTNQTTILTFVLASWLMYYGLYIEVREILATFITIMVLELIMQYVKYGNMSLMTIRYAWVFNAIWGISFFLRTDEILLYVLAWALAVLGKYVFTTKDGRHFLNPSNMAVSLILIFFPVVAWTNPLQWGFYADMYETWIIYAVLLFFWIFMSYRVLKQLHIPIWITTLAFALTQLFIFTFFTKESTAFQYMTYFNPGWLIFIFFMITDPRTNPISKLWCMFHWIAVGLLFFVLQYYINENYSNLLALFAMTWTLPFVWKLEQKKWIYHLSLANILQISLIFAFIGIFIYNVYQSWLPDLLFENRCGQLLCI